jgi:hypothetical protein
MAVTVDLVVDENGAPSITRLDEEDSPSEIAEYMTWSRQYFDVRLLYLGIIFE